MSFFLLYDLVHGPGVRELPQLDEPYFPGPASHLGEEFSVCISSPFLESPDNLFMLDLLCAPSAVGAGYKAAR
jgi:hypothetical protein